MNDELRYILSRAAQDKQSRRAFVARAGALGLSSTLASGLLAQAGLLIAARGELDQVKRKSMYSEMAHILRDEGGLILPMFNDFVEAVSDAEAVWVPDPNSELMNGRAMTKCWLA